MTQEELSKLDSLYQQAHRQVQPHEADQQQARRDKIVASAAFISELVLAWPRIRAALRKEEG